MDLLKELVLTLARCSFLKASRADWMSAREELGLRSRALRADLSSLAGLEILWRNVLLYVGLRSAEVGWWSMRHLDAAFQSMVVMV